MKDFNNIPLLSNLSVRFPAGCPFGELKLLQRDKMVDMCWPHEPNLSKNEGCFNTFRALISLINFIISQSNFYRFAHPCKQIKIDNIAT